MLKSFFSLKGGAKNKKAIRFTESDAFNELPNFNKSGMDFGEYMFFCINKRIEWEKSNA